MQHGDLLHVVRDTLDEFEASLQARQINAEIISNDANFELILDGLRMGQVVRNLLSNAVKFSPEGSHIWLTLRHVRDATQQCVELIVADEGVGIPDSECERVFDKFVQSSYTQTNAGGTGLGLSICREIVQAHKGEIFARRRHPVGTELVVRLPVSLTPACV